MSGAAAWLAADEEALAWVELQRESQARGVYIIRAQIRRVGVELLAAHGVEHAVLMGAVHQGLTEDRAVRRIDIAQRKHDQLRREIAERLAALDGLDGETVAEARAELQQRRQALAESAEQLAEQRTAQVRQVVDRVVKRDPRKSARQHAAMVCAGLVQLEVVRPAAEGQADKDRAVLRPAGPVQLVMAREEHDEKRGRYHLPRIFSRDEVFELSEAIYDHSTRGAGGRRVIETFHEDAGGREDGGDAVGPERAAGAAGDQAGAAGPLPADLDVRLPRDARDRTDPAGRRDPGDPSGRGVSGTGEGGGDG